MRTYRGKPLPALRVYQVNESFFEPLTPASAYVVGFIAADGSLASHNTSEINLSNTEVEVLEKINAAMGSTYPIKTSVPKNPSWKPQHRFVFYSHLLYKSLLGVGLTPRKSLTLTMPSVPDALFFHFLRGYFDGDGCVQPNGKGVLIGFVSASEAFLLAVAQRCAALLKIPEQVLYPDKKTGRSWHLAYHGFTAFAIADAMYKDADNLFLSRKRNLLETFRGHTMHRPKWMAEQATEKRCPHCTLTKPLGDFHVSRRSHDGRDAYCRTCANKLNTLKKARLRFAKATGR